MGMDAVIVVGEPAMVNCPEVAPLIPVPLVIVLHPNPVPVVHIRAFDAPEQDGRASPDGAVAVSAPRTVFAVCVANAELGIALAATAREGVVVEVVTVGTSHVGHDPEGAANEVTVPPPPLYGTLVHVPLSQFVIERSRLKLHSPFSEHDPVGAVAEDRS